MSRKINLKDYEIGRTLGTGIFLKFNHSGSFGRVKITRNKKTGKHPAVKILKKHEIIRLK